MISLDLPIRTESEANSVNKGLKWSEVDLVVLKNAYEGAKLNPDIGLDALAKTLGRHKSNVSRKARSLGLTDIARKRVERLKSSPKYGHYGSKELSDYCSKRQKDRIKTNGHPRGALGLKHTPEAKKKMVEATRRAWADPNSKLNSPELAQKRSDRMVERVLSGKMRSGFYTRCAGGRRKDLGDTYFRSSWEANYARYLNWLKLNKQIEKWEYEVHTFVFEKIKRGSRAYTPDFKVTYANGRYEWHEVKGWMDQKSATKLRRMGKYFPDEKVVLVDSAWFKAVMRQGIASLVPGWETKARRSNGD